MMPALRVMQVRLAAATAASERDLAATQSTGPLVGSVSRR